VAGAIVNNSLKKNLPRRVPGLPLHLADAVLKSVSAIRDLDDEWKPLVKEVYSRALGKWLHPTYAIRLTHSFAGYAFVIGIPIGVLAVMTTAL